MPLRRSAGMAAVLSIGLLVIPPSHAAEPVRVHVQEGTLVGALDGDVSSFKGIPYAAPPIGPLKWALPKAPLHWRGERRADDFGFSCMQPTVPLDLPPNSRAAQFSEDCLTLNVWAPQGAKRAPVMVMIHGGSNEKGTAATTYLDGTTFARDGIVLVSMNYRLGELGFMPHNGAANFGLWDQVAALQWVRANIGAFGGDPANVTLSGSSAGGSDTLVLMTAAPAKGLFQKAIVESAGDVWHTPASLAEASGANGSQPKPGFVIDGHLLQEPPLNAFVAGRAAHIPLLIGTNNWDGSIFGHTPPIAAIFPEKLSKDVWAKLAALYGAQASNNDDLARLVVRDSFFASPARWLASSVGAAGSSAYLYRFDYVPASLRPQRTGAFHGTQIFFVFDNLQLVHPQDDDRRVARAMHECWTAFVKTGKPTCAAIPEWPTFAASGKWAVFDAQPSVRPFEGAEALDLLQCRLAEGPVLASMGCASK